MDVKLNHLLNSAEKLIQEKDLVSSKSKATTGLTEQATVAKTTGMGDTAEFSNLLTGKFHTIQAKLSDLQSQLTREQMRLSYLTEGTPEPTELIHVLFGKEPLFPELQKSSNVDLLNLRKETEKKLVELEKEIRYKEVENENVVALGLFQKDSGFSELLKGIETISWKPINEKTVQKLIES